MKKIPIILLTISLLFVFMYIPVENNVNAKAKTLRQMKAELAKYEKDYHIHFSDIEEQYLKFISIKLSSGKRIQELETIKLSIERKTSLIDELKKKMEIQDLQHIIEDMK